MTLQEIIDGLAGQGKSVYVEKTANPAPEFHIVQIIIVTPVGDDEAYVEHEKYAVRLVGGVEDARKWVAKPAAEVVDETPKLDASEADIEDAIRAFEADSGRKVVSKPSVSYTKGVAVVYAETTDGAGFFSSTWIVEKDKDVLVVHPQKV